MILIQMDLNLRIPQDKRHLFTEPLDVLIAGTREETIPQVVNIFKDNIKSGVKINFYIVGDIVAKDFLKNQFLKKFIKICIIDEKTQRNRINLDFEDFFEHTIELHNPEGTINKDCWKFFREIINSEKRTLIKITEGDLIIEEASQTIVEDVVTPDSTQEDAQETTIAPQESVEDLCDGCLLGDNCVTFGFRSEGEYCGIERQFEDALNIAKVQAQTLDRDYLSKWAEELSVDILVQRLFSQL